MALLVLLALQGGDVDRRVEGLGSEEIAERDRATTALRRMGAKALPALQQALDSEDAEVRGRASDLLAWFARGAPAARIFKLRNADPSQVASLLRAVFQGTGGFEASVDPRTRSLVVVGLEGDPWEVVDQVVAELDRDPTES